MLYVKSCAYNIDTGRLEIEDEPGDSLDTNGLSLIVEYSNGYSKEIESGFDLSYDFSSYVSAFRVKQTA